MASSTSEVPEAVPPGHGQHRRVLVQAPLGGEHVAAAEPLLAPAVAPQPHQLGRAFDPRQHGRELLGVLGVAVDEPGEVAPGEGRLVLGQDGERHLGVGQDAAGVALDHLQLVGQPSGAALHGLVAAALDLETTGGVAAMVDPGAEPACGELLVDAHGQLLAPLLHQGRGVPGPLLGPEAGGPDPAQRQEDVGMDLGAAAVRHGLAAVHVEIGDHAPVDEQLLHEGPGQLDVLGIRELVRQREFHIAGKLGVLAPLPRLHVVPQPLPVGERVRSPRRQQDRRVQEVGLVLEVVGPAAPVVV